MDFSLSLGPKWFQVLSTISTFCRVKVNFFFSVVGLKCYEYREVQGEDAGKTELVECSSSQKACFLEIKQYDNPWQKGWKIEQECATNFEFDGCMNDEKRGGSKFADGYLGTGCFCITDGWVYMEIQVLWDLHISVIRCNVQGLSGIDLSPKSGCTMFLGNIFIILVLVLSHHF